MNKRLMGFLLLGLVLKSFGASCDFSPALGQQITNSLFNTPQTVCIPNGATTMTVTTSGGGGGLGGVIAHFDDSGGGGDGWSVAYRNGGGYGGEASVVYYQDSVSMYYRALIIAAGGGGGGGAEMDVERPKKEARSIQKSLPGNGGNGAVITATYNLTKLNINNNMIEFVAGQAGACDQGTNVICSSFPGGNMNLTSPEFTQITLSSQSGEKGNNAYCPDLNTTVPSPLVSAFYPIGGSGGYNYFIQGNVGQGSSPNGRSVDKTTIPQLLKWLTQDVPLSYSRDNTSNLVESDGGISAGFGGGGGGGYPGGAGGGSGNLDCAAYCGDSVNWDLGDGAPPYSWLSSTPLSTSQNGVQAQYQKGSFYGAGAGAGGGGDGGYSVVKEEYALIGSASCNTTTTTSGASAVFIGGTSGSGIQTTSADAGWVTITFN